MPANTEFWRFVECQKSNTSYRVPKMHRMLYLYTVSPEKRARTLYSTPLYPSTLLYSTLSLYSPLLLYPSTLLYHSRRNRFRQRSGPEQIKSDAFRITNSEPGSIEIAKNRRTSVLWLMVLSTKIDTACTIRPHLYHAKRCGAAENTFPTMWRLHVGRVYESLSLSPHKESGRV